MFLNIKKCFIISFSTRNPKHKYHYTINGQVLERKVEARDLGVIFDYQLSFRSHYNHVVARCNQLNGFLLRMCKHFKKPSTLCYLFSTLVRPLIEYGSIIWSPYYKVHQDNIERVPKRCLTSICRRFGLHRVMKAYDKKLNYFKISSLISRRQRNGLLFLFKLIHSLIDCPELLMQINLNTNHRIRNPLTFTVPSAKNNVSFNNPLFVMCRSYNDAKLDGIDIFGLSYGQFRNYVLKLHP